MRVLVGETGSGERWIAASSMSGGCAVARVRMLRARRVAFSISFSFCARCSRPCFHFWTAASATCRSVILVLRLLSAIFEGSMVRPREQASEASAILSRVSRAREDR